MLAVGLLERANTESAAPECAAMATFCWVTGAGRGLGRFGWFGSACWNDAKPPTVVWPEIAKLPGGWFAMVSRKFFARFVKFCERITKARCTVVLRGFESCGDETSSPWVIRLW